MEKPLWKLFGLFAVSGLILQNSPCMAADMRIQESTENLVSRNIEHFDEGMVQVLRTMFQSIHSNEEESKYLPELRALFQDIKADVENQVRNDSNAWLRYHYIMRHFINLSPEIGNYSFLHPQDKSVINVLWKYLNEVRPFKPDLFHLLFNSLKGTSALSEENASSILKTFSNPNLPGNLFSLRSIRLPDETIYMLFNPRTEYEFKNYKKNLYFHTEILGAAFSNNTTALTILIEALPEEAVSMISDILVDYYTNRNSIECLIRLQGSSSERLRKIHNLILQRKENLSIAR